MTTPDFERLGRYALVRKLATGGMADVYLARVDGPGGFEKQVVLKRILPELARSPAFVEMFLREARLAASFDHPNLAHVFDFGHEGDAYYLTMEYVDGPTLRQVRRRAETQGWQLPVDAVAIMIAKACEALHYVHELRDPRTDEPMGLVHRDVSPDNLIVSRKGNVKVLDFGIAKDPNVESTTRSGTVRGKLHYMAPEQLNEQPLDRRVDVWALGVVLFELLTLKKPYLGTADAAVMKAILFDPLIPVQRLRPDVPEALARILDRCLMKDRDQRIGSAQELQYALEEFVAASGHRLGSYDLAMMVNDLVEGRPPRSGQSTLKTPRVSFEDLRAAATPPKPAPAPETSLQPALAEATKTTTEESSTGSAEATRTATTETPAKPKALAPKRSRAALVVLGGLALALVLGVGVKIGLRSASSERPVLAEATPVEKTQPVDAPREPTAAKVEPVVKTEVVDAPREPTAAKTEPVDAPPEPTAATPEPMTPEVPAAVEKSARLKLRPPVKAASRKSALEIRVLPEGTVQLDGAPPPTTITSGPHTFLFTNRRFGTTSKSVEVSPCEGRIIVGYSFQSDKLTVACRAQ